MRSRIKSALFLVLISILTVSIIGATIVAINGEFTKSAFLNISKLLFWLFGAPFISAVILLLVTKLEAAHCISFGSALYYGTIFVSIFLNDFIITDEINLFIISFVLVALVCYIYWLKAIKNKEE